MKLPLAKAWSEADHPRDEDGQFTEKSGGGAKAGPGRLITEGEARNRAAMGHNGGPAMREQRRSLTRGEFWQRRGALYASRYNEIPVEYTGSREKEKPVGSFTERKIVEQIPKSVSVEEHQALFGRLKQVVRTDRQAERSWACRSCHSRTRR